MAIRLSVAGLLFLFVPLSVIQADDDFWDPTFGPQGMNDAVYDIVLHGEYVYAGGRFTMAGDLDVGRVARWDGVSWSDICGGVGQPTGYDAVTALLFHDGVLYVGGVFQGAGNTPAMNIARWDGSQWLEMGGFDGQVHDLEFFDGDIYACGDFYRSGSTVLNGIARWDGSGWQPMGNGLKVGTDVGTGNSMDTNDTHLYVGGYFTKAGNITAIKTAKWDGSTWSTGAGIMRGYVQAILAVGSDVYVGGTFNFSGLSNIGRWDGSWDNLGGGADLHVLALSELEGEIYAAGSFWFMGGLSVHNVARWDGTAWSGFGRGLYGSALGAYTIAPKSSTEFWVGGTFTRAGGKESRYIAHWQADPPVPTEEKRWGGIKEIYQDR
ncbi:MAG: hypothetical protein JSW50_06855 [Candidatus Latescibacterota bacterium]|nr:MAG: hypothetical protein JSW50_06855 [Candidatus Latescibacterota bacterium]